MKGDYATYHKTEVFCKCSECTGECGPRGKSIPKWKEREHHKKEAECKKAPRMRPESIKTIETLAAHQIMQQPEAGPSQHVVEAIAAKNHPFEPPEPRHLLSPKQPESPPNMDIDYFDVDKSWNDLPNVGSVVPSVERMIGETSGVSASGDSAPDPQLITVPTDDDYADDLCSVISKELPAALNTDVDINFIPDDGQDDLMSLDGGHEMVEICATEPSNGIDDDGSQAPVVPTHAHNPQMHLEDAITHETTVEGELVLELPHPPSVVLAAASPHWFWKIILLLIAWLNLHYHLPHLACTLILKITRHILIGLTVLAPNKKVAGSLNTVFNHLNIKDNFNIHPVFPVCHHVYPHDSQGDTKCLNCSEPLFELSASRTKPRPHLQCPQNPLSNAILRLLSRAGIEEELDAWHCHVPDPGKRALIQDDEIWKTIKGNDGELFFDNSPEHPDKDKLRIGITLGFDGNAQLGCPVKLYCELADTFAILTTKSHGPKEFDSNELQFFMKNYVNNLISLYENGIMVKTPNYPNGRQVHMILVAVCCDHPVLCKVCRFGGHRKEEGFCTRCHIKHSELKTRDTMDYDIRMSVIDPMHSFLLGIIHCHWYDSWIQTNTIRKRTDKNKRELDQIHDYIATFEMPNWVGCLPEQVGYPAGGSLTSDEWKGLASVFCPIVEWYPKVNATYEKVLTSWENREKQ
ncbi:hypothetical protein DFH29DRAFT_874615 [Suillus ampliporus]|nr:hypothetical protein DFH29DRAFT_874615 [Suillus ampliporus]